MSDKLIDEKLKKVEAEFNRLKGEIEKDQEAINEANRHISVKREELVRLQGEYRVLKELKNPVKEKPKKEKSKTE